MESAGLEPTTNRIRVLEVVGNNRYPLTATDIYTTVERTHQINRVTVYRILDLLVEKQLLEKLAVGGRAAYYGMAPNEHHERHPHFYCTACGQMDCLTPDSLPIDQENLKKYLPGHISKIEIRVDGLCKNCLKNTNQ